MASSADTTIPPTAPPVPPPVRASDADRAATVRVLQDAVARGLLTPDEGGERMAQAFAAVHLRELGPLTDDLPPAPAAGTAPGWRVIAMMAVEQLRATLTAPTTGRLRPVRVAVAVVLALLLVAAVATVAGNLIFDGGHGVDGGGFDRGGFGRR
jgi:hypothetical protein